MEICNYAAIAVVCSAAGFLCGISVGYDSRDAEIKAIAEADDMIDEGEIGKPGPQLVTNRTGAPQ